ncbi:arginine metabolism regulation protein 3 [Sporothrix schenckii 1099-18]|uniref:Kinase n=1 Tax=Sporothrix schenckii 1099-18 TaxID=1397361 RepID=A0A0F2M6D6_SPOSC|nr:arginine metabolism regulation protein 3 [Sporothrix schenckii 1099-18]KJR84365.1 arginine metabolism regulation protein 3 [Sporothrix schenckii 1099-18]
MAPREMPKVSELRAYKNAVAGHAGTLSDANGDLFIKPCVQAEIDFYQRVFQGDHAALASIIPLYMGELSLTETTDAAAAAVAAAGGVVSADVQQAIAGLDTQTTQQEQRPAPSLPATTSPATSATVAGPTAASQTAPAPPDNVTWIPRGNASINSDRAVVLDNATQGYKKPNIMDVKLGRRLWGDSAPLQKRQRMDDVSAKTTHATYGFRISGMRVYQGDAAAAAAQDPTSDGAGYRIYDKDYGRIEVNDSNVVDAFRTFLFNEAAGVDDAHGRAVAEAFKAELERVRDVLESEHTRMYSSSLLFVYEGDGATLQAAIAEGNARATAREARQRERQQRELNLSPTPIRVVEAESACEEPQTSTTVVSLLDTEAADAAVDVDQRSRSRREVLGKAADRSSSRTDSGIVIDEDEMEDHLTVDVRNLTEADFSFGDDVVGIIGADDYDDDDDDDDASDTGSDSDGESKSPPIFGLRLIDFANAKFVSPAEGPDENNIAGVRSLIAIFDELTK